MVFIIQFISIAIELSIAILGLMIALQKKKKYGFGIFATFFIYVFYDLSRVVGSTLTEYFWNGLFFIATISAWYAVWYIYKDGLIKLKNPLKAKRGKRK